MTNNDCLFCKIIAGSIPSHRVYEDEQILAFLDIHPVNPGHTLFIPKTHSENFLLSDAGDAQSVIAAIQKITPGILKAVGAIAANITTNNGKAAGQIVPHTHWHVMPRFETDGYEMWHGKERKDLGEMAQKIREFIS